jgi:hypothetical protein
VSLKLPDKTAILQHWGVSPPPQPPSSYSPVFYIEMKLSCVENDGGTVQHINCNLLYMRKNLTTCQQHVFAPFVLSYWQVWNKLYHLVTTLMRPTDLQQVVPTSLWQWQHAHSNLLRTTCISLVGTTWTKSVMIINWKFNQGIAYRRGDGCETH